AGGDEAQVAAHRECSDLRTFLEREIDEARIAERGRDGTAGAQREDAGRARRRTADRDEQAALNEPSGNRADGARDGVRSPVAAEARVGAHQTAIPKGIDGDSVAAEHRDHRAVVRAVAKRAAGDDDATEIIERDGSRDQRFVAADPRPALVAECRVEVAIRQY